MKPGFYFTSALLLLISVFCLGQDNDYALDISISPAVMTVGDEVTIVYSLTSLKGHSLRIDPLEEDSEKYLIAQQEIVEELNLMGLPRLKRIIRLIPFETGKIEIPTRVVEVIDAQGNSTVGSTPMLTLNVISIAASEKGPEEVKELQDIIPLPEEDHTWIWISVISGAVIITGLLIWSLFRTAPPASLRDLIKLTPAQRALEDLNELRKSDLLKQGLSKNFYTRLAFILKRYLGLRYRLLALEMTSGELSCQMQDCWRNIDADIKEFDGVMNICDLTKFALFTPPDSESVRWVDATRRIILETRDDLMEVEKQNRNQGGKE